MIKRNIPDDFILDGAELPYSEVFSLICNNIMISDSINGRFMYFIDDSYVMDTTRGYRYENITPAFDKILLHGIDQLKYPEATTAFMKNYNSVCDDLCLLSDRISTYLRCENNNDRRIAWFENMKERPAEHFEEAIQRMLFVDQIFWQTDHRLVGLGAWDSFLFPYYEMDIKRGIIDKAQALIILEDLCRILHENYSYKSNVLTGDTGQIFVLGRSDPEGRYVCNELTYLFIQAIKNVQLPDPKCLLRINRNTPDDLLKLALESISTGVGAPLLANDDVIIPCLTGFGILMKDACEYTTSACWEPLIGGKSVCNNNRAPLNYLKPSNDLFDRADLTQIQSFADLVEEYLICLKRYIRTLIRLLRTHVFQNNPLLSVFTYGCYECGKDVSHGGGLYGDLGITSVAMGNTLNALYNIKKYVFENGELTLYDVKKMMITDFEGNDEVLETLKKEGSRYGKDEAEYIDLVQRIMDCASTELAGYSDAKGNRIKMGLSGSAYMDAARSFGASFDGRHAKEPFNVHISNEENSGFTQIIRFASALDYSKNQFNGNVIDLMMSPGFITDNMEKMVLLLKGAVASGFFEMQMNVVDSRTLIEAREHPEDFPNLIVRVWGFSAYFKDLPDEYKDILIRRALTHERSNDVCR